jgi:hypothetical protein
MHHPLLTSISSPPVSDLIDVSRFGALLRLGKFDK